MLFVKIFSARWKYLKDNKNKNYFIVGKIGHMKSGFPIRKSKDYSRSRTVYDDQ